MKQRITITIDEEVLNQYKELAHEGRTNLSKCINDWLAETAPALSHMTSLIKAAKESPARAIAGLEVFHEQIAGELGELRDGLAVLAGGESACPPAETARTDTRSQPPAGAQISPHSNTGLKPPSA